MTIKEFDDFDFGKFFGNKNHDCVYHYNNETYHVIGFDKSEKLVKITQLAKPEIDEDLFWVRCENVTLLPF